MSLNTKLVLEDHVHPEWVDYNGHMNDAEYARVFSIAVDRLMDMIGINADFRRQCHYSIYTLETHLCYLAEACEGQTLRVTMQLIDHDIKRLHVFFVMENAKREQLATSEQMLMGMDMLQGRPAPFPPAIEKLIQGLMATQKDLPIPENAGRKIGIRKSRP